MTITTLLGAPWEPLDRHEQCVVVLLTVFRGKGKYYNVYCRMERQLPEPLGTNIAFMEKMNHILMLPSKNRGTCLFTGLGGVVREWTPQNWRGK
jgi:hypothetical protein